MKTTLQTDISPITNNIYTGRAVPGANHWSGEKKDAADRETKEVTAYEIEVKKQKRPGGAK